MKMKVIFFLTLLFLLTGCSNKLFMSQNNLKLEYHKKQYGVIQAGDQYWMSENLATTTYRFGKKIPLITDYNMWPEVKTPACGYYQNDTSNLHKYGMLYNWYAVNKGKLCPAGWGVPSYEDWLKLEKYLGGENIAGGKMKAIAGWKGRHVSGDDIGFKALPGGYRLNDDFLEGFEGIWWTRTVADASYFQKINMNDTYQKLLSGSIIYIWGRKISYKSTELISTLNQRENGFSVRCVKIKKRK
jgi:uncharacterized protein (TIGR02145 family)